MALQQKFLWSIFLLSAAAAACSSPTTAAGQGGDADVAAASDVADALATSDLSTAADSADVAAQDAATGADSWVDAGPTDSSAGDTWPGDTWPGDTWPGDAPAGDTSASDVATAQDTASGADATYDAGCSPCNLDCVCKTDYNGCPLQECESATCLDLMGQIAALKPKVTTCSADKGCQPFEFPICGSVGCFQLGVGAGNDLTELENLAGKAGAAQCSGFHCGCGPAAPTFCFKGQCQTCPPNCDGTCDEKLAALLSVAKQAASFCGSDSDCTVVATGMCPVGGLPCGGIPANKYSKTEVLSGLVAAYSAPCGAAMCKCAVPGPAKCVQGHCVVAP